MEKSILVCLLLTAFSFQCSDRNNVPADDFKGLSSEVRAEIKTSTIAMTALSRKFFPIATLREKGVSKERLNELFSAYRETMKDEKSKQIFDVLGQHDVTKGYLNWQLEAVKITKEISAGRTQTEYWDESELMSGAVKTYLSGVKADIDAAMITYYNLTAPDLIIDIRYILSTYISNLPYNSTLTSDEKGQASIALSSAYDAVPDIIAALDDSSEDQKIAFNMSRFMHKVGSVVLHIAVAAFVVTVAALIITETFGVGAALLTDSLIHIGTWQLGVAATAAAYGAAAGLAVGVFQAFNDQCLDSAGQTIGYSSC